MPGQNVIRVCLPLPVKGEFDYSSEIEVLPGERVFVPFGRKKIIGYCTASQIQNSVRGLKKIIKKIDDKPVLTDELLNLSLMMEKRYFTSRGMALKMILPPEIKGKPRRLPDGLDGCAGQKAAAVKIKGKNPLNKGLNYITGNLSEIGGLLKKSIADTVSHGRQVIFLVPQRFDIKKYSGIFEGFRWTSFNSQMTHAQRYAVLKAASTGGIDIVSGTRSAVFTPFRKTGLIVMMDPENRNYDEEQHPRYSTEEIAINRAVSNKASFAGVCGVLSVAAYRRVVEGEAVKIELPYEGKIKTRVLDISDRKTDFGVSPELMKEIKKTLDSKRGAVLYMPGGGWASSYVCSVCGFKMKCEKCSAPLVVSNFALYCTKCLKKYPLPERCPRCHRKKMKNRGFGRTMLASFLTRKLPRNTVRSVGVGSSFAEKEKLFEDFSSGRTDILVSDASFMHIKDWSKAGMLALLDADSFLYGGGWSAEEKTYMRLGRIKNYIRGFAGNTQLFVQTKAAFELCEKALSQDAVFYKEQLEERKKFLFPPFYRIIRVRIEGKNAKEACGKFEEASGGNIAEISRPAETGTPAGKKSYEIVIKIKQDAVFTLPAFRGCRISAEEEL